MIFSFETGHYMAAEKKCWRVFPAHLMDARADIDLTLIHSVRPARIFLPLI